MAGKPCLYRRRQYPEKNGWRMADEKLAKEAKDAQS